MNDAAYALSVAYAELMAGFSYNGQVVKVYDQIADNNAKAPYIIMGPWVATSDNTKCGFGQTGQIVLDVVNRLPGNQQSRRAVTEIANLLTRLLKPDTTAEVLNVPGFQSWNTRIVGAQDDTQRTNTDTVVRKLITVEHSLWQA
ncbi:hypothetical protein GCM10028807_57860 [Spirosoma daeguense]